MEWSLHPQLVADTVPVGDLALSRVLLENDSNYPWLILVPRMPGVTELTDLDPNEQVQLLSEIDAAAKALKAVTEFDKLNVAALGNGADRQYAEARRARRGHHRGPAFGRAGNGRRVAQRRR